MRRSYTLLLALPLALAACVPGVAEYTKTEAPAELQINGGERVLTVAFAPGSAWLSARQAADIGRLVHNGDLRPADRVDIAAAGGTDLAQQRVAVISRALLRYGIVADKSQLAGVPPNRAYVIIGRYAVTLPPCPNWSQAATSTDFTNQTSSNYGCANAINLGMTVANPADLVAGRTLEAANGKPSVSAVNRYLTDQVIPPVIVQVGPITTSSTTTTTPPAAAGVP
jgi:pilus assembly protein CpaD